MHKNNENSSPKLRKLRKMSKIRLQNIALYYLQRFDSSAENLRNVLMRRTYDYARQVENFDINEAENWIDEIISHFEELGYLNDVRYTDFKIDNYISAGKSQRYIRQKLRQKGVSEKLVDEVFQDKDYNEFNTAVAFARKKQIGPWRKDEQSRCENRNKDLASLLRAGFDFDVAQKIIGSENSDFDV